MEKDSDKSFDMAASYFAPPYTFTPNFSSAPAVITLSINKTVTNIIILFRFISSSLLDSLFYLTLYLLPALFLYQLDPAVLGPAFFCLVIRNRFILSMSCRTQAFWINALGDYSNN